MKTKIIAIVNQKGGSSKTTTTSLIAKSLLSRGKNILIIDTDPQGGISSIYHKDPRGEFPHVKEKGIYDILIGEDPLLNENVFESYIDPRIHIIPSDYRLDKIFLTISPYSLENSFRGFSKNYDYILIDTPPTIQGITRASILFSDKIYVPCEISRQSLQPTLYTMNSIKEQKKEGKVIFIGYKDPGEKKGFQSDLSREFMKTFKKNLIGIIPKTSSATSFSSEKKNPSKSIRENIIDSIVGFV